MRFIEQQRFLQREVFGDDRPRPLTGEDLNESVQMNIVCAEHELHEALDLVKGWKPWSTKQPVIEDRDAYVEELVDAAHFLANLFIAVDCDDDEFERVYLAKDEINAQRQIDGYDR